MSKIWNGGWPHITSDYISWFIMNYTNNCYLHTSWDVYPIKSHQNQNPVCFCAGKPTGYPTGVWGFLWPFCRGVAPKAHIWGFINFNFLGRQSLEKHGMLPFWGHYRSGPQPNGGNGLQKLVTRSFAFGNEIPDAKITDYIGILS